MIWWIILVEIIISIPLAIAISKSCFGNMDKEYYDEINFSEKEPIENEINEIILFGISQEENDYEKEI